jgi:hypothetical protein
MIPQSSLKKLPQVQLKLPLLRVQSNNLSINQLMLQLPQSSLKKSPQDLLKVQLNNPLMELLPQDQSKLRTPLINQLLTLQLPQSSLKKSPQDLSKLPQLRVQSNNLLSNQLMEKLLHSYQKIPPQVPLKSNQLRLNQFKLP